MAKFQAIFEVLQTKSDIGQRRLMVRHSPFS